MCDPVTIGLILTAAGGGTKAVNANISARRQDRAAAEGIRQQGELQRGANEQLNERVAEIGANTGEAERGAALEGFLNTLRESDDLTGADADPLALGGQRFAERVSGGEATTRKIGTERAGRLSVIDAAGRQRVAERGRVADTAGQLSEIERQSKAKNFITQLRIASKRPNAFVDAFGTVLQGAGSVVALGAGGGPNLTKLFSKGTLVDPALTGTPILPTLGATPPPIFA